MRMETFIRKSLGLKAHTVGKVAEGDGVQTVAVLVERMGQRRLRWGDCGRAARAVASVRRRHPENGTGHPSRMGRTGRWDVTWSADQPGREENMVHLVTLG